MHISLHLVTFKRVGGGQVYLLIGSRGLKTQSE